MKIHTSHRMPNPLWKNPTDPNRFIEEYPRCKRCSKFLSLNTPCDKAPKHEQRNGTVEDKT